MLSSKKKLNKFSGTLVANVARSVDKWVQRTLDDSSESGIDHSISKLLDKKLDALVLTFLGLRGPFYDSSNKNSKPLYQLDPFAKTRGDGVNEVFKALQEPLIRYAKSWAKKNITKEYMEAYLKPVEAEVRRRVLETLSYEMERELRDALAKKTQNHVRAFSEALLKTLTEEMTLKEEELKELIAVALEE